MSEQDSTTSHPIDPQSQTKIQHLRVRLSNDWFFLKQRIRMAWWPNKIRQLDRERKDWKRWCEDAERRLGEALNGKQKVGAE